MQSPVPNAGRPRRGQGKPLALDVQAHGLLIVEGEGGRELDAGAIGSGRQSPLQRRRARHLLGVARRSRRRRLDGSLDWLSRASFFAGFARPRARVRRHRGRDRCGRVLQGQRHSRDHQDGCSSNGMKEETHDTIREQRSFHACACVKSVLEAEVAGPEAPMAQARRGKRALPRRRQRPRSAWSGAPGACRLRAPRFVGLLSQPTKGHLECDARSCSRPRCTSASWPHAADEPPISPPPPWRRGRRPPRRAPRWLLRRQRATMADCQSR